MKRIGLFVLLAIGFVVGCGDSPKESEVKTTRENPDSRIERAGKQVEAQGVHKKAGFKDR